MSSSAPTPIPLDFVDSIRDKFDAEPRYTIAQNGITAGKWRDVVCNRREISRQTHVFSKKLPDTDACNQNETGRCWLFATSTVLRRALKQKYNLKKDFEISQNFFYFWDKFEKCNFFLENILATANDPVDSRLVAHFLNDPTNDGGQWDMVVNIVNKYGACPKNVFGESTQTLDSTILNGLLSSKLREFAKQLRDLQASHASPTAIHEAKLSMLEVCHRILAIHLGSPPTSFDFEVHDKDQRHVRVSNLTPRSFVQSVVPLDLNEYVSIVHDPRNAFSTILTVDRLGNVVEGKRVKYLNLSIEHLWRYAKLQLDADMPVWFGCDCDADSELDLHGIYSTKLYDMEAVFGTKYGLTKKERLEFKAGSMTHAMVFVGYNVHDGEDKPSSWKVENSWGPQRGAKGFDVMTADWFEEHMYQVVVHKKFLKPKHAQVWEHGSPIVLPVWDPMGNCL
ncbi:unnamed protein product [Aphanomyces euteiches]|uniref:bleomycin hydrolase n=1 Tax=Aphanomyces euteiches TaxID=100861 RepID=A0A6G0X2N4_9STRA|nr:hypothetical protein Ae201684_009039 [Aphanomyces euteiches]KAH9073760.1 hypothetical protein Ae201684P_003263 [Aphanomyces euteiches]KAH9151037.1 hypothetical protein AeRB84_006244 [Aphanomyces euteiches]